jgi:methionyl-tRNA synthetase
MTSSGWGFDEKLWKTWWPADLHVIGKDIIRFHAVYWPAMLMSAKLSLPKGLLVHGFISSGGRKMSKSIGNVIDPYEIINKYGVEAFRYFLLSQIPTQDDGDFTIKRFEQVYQSDLANGIGNLVSRVAGLAKDTMLGEKSEDKVELSENVAKAIERFELDKAMAFIWNEIRKADTFINEKTVWSLKGKEKDQAIESLVNIVRQIAYDLKPFLPETSKKIQSQYEGLKVKSEKALFPRLDK